MGEGEEKGEESGGKRKRYKEETKGTGRNERRRRESERKETGIKKRAEGRRE